MVKNKEKQNKAASPTPEKEIPETPLTNKTVRRRHNRTVQPESRRRVGESSLVPVWREAALSRSIAHRHQPPRVRGGTFRRHERALFTHDLTQSAPHFRVLSLGTLIPSLYLKKESQRLIQRNSSPSSQRLGAA